MEQQQLLEYQPLARPGQRLLPGGEMDIFHGEPPHTQGVLLPQRKGEGIVVQLLVQQGQRLGHRRFDHPGGEPFGLGINRPDPLAGFRRLDQRGSHFKAAGAAGDGPKKQVFPAAPDFFGGVAVVEHGHLHGGNAVAYREGV